MSCLKEPYESGIGPASLLPLKNITLIVGSWEREAGSGPESLLSWRARDQRVLIWARKWGIGPETLVLKM